MYLSLHSALVFPYLLRMQQVNLFIELRVESEVTRYNHKGVKMIPSRSPHLFRRAHARNNYYSRGLIPPKISSLTWKLKKTRIQFLLQTWLVGLGQIREDGGLVWLENATSELWWCYSRAIISPVNCNLWQPYMDYGAAGGCIIKCCQVKVCWGVTTTHQRCISHPAIRFSLTGWDLTLEISSPRYLRDKARHYTPTWGMF